MRLEQRVLNTDTSFHKLKVHLFSAGQEAVAYEVVKFVCCASVFRSVLACEL